MVADMKREQMNRIVNEELSHIPRGAKRTLQRGLRMMYNMIRRRELARNPSARRSDSLALAIKRIRDNEANFNPQYDKSFFEH